jgi:4-nitrophenyl phosphatase
LSQVSAIILAAGPSSRFGQPKQLLDWGGVPLVAHIARIALAADLEPVIVVLGSDAPALRTALAGSPVTVLMNWRWQDGLSTSVRTGLAALPPEAEAVLLLQCDQPLVTPGLIRDLVERQSETSASIVYPTHDGNRGTPVLFTRELFGELAAVEGDQGGRAILGQHQDDIATVEVADPDLLADADTPSDYDRLKQRMTERTTGQAILARLRGLMIDMDGVLWRGDEALPGLVRFFAFLAERGIKYVLATNNASKVPEQYVAKLAGFGVEVDQECILTSGQAAAAYLGDVAPRGTRVYAIGEEGVQRPLRQQGFVISEEDAEYVVVGWDRKLSWTKLAAAALLIHAGARFIGTNPDKSFPTERGPVPGNGAQLAALEAATGVPPTVVGKPEPRMYAEALRRLGTKRENTAVLGDRLDTDILGARKAGLPSVLLLSGISTRNDLRGSPERPDLVCDGIDELTSIWEQVASR